MTARHAIAAAPLADRMVRFYAVRLMKLIGHDQTTRILALLNEPAIDLAVAEAGCARILAATALDTAEARRAAFELDMLTFCIREDEIERETQELEAQAEAVLEASIAELQARIDARAARTAAPANDAPTESPTERAA